MCFLPTTEMILSDNRNKRTECKQTPRLICERKIGVKVGLSDIRRGVKIIGLLRLYY